MKFTFYYALTSTSPPITLGDPAPGVTVSTTTSMVGALINVPSAETALPPSVTSPLHQCIYCPAFRQNAAVPSGRLLSYVKPRIGENQFGGESVTYEGVGSTKKWERIESYGPKFVENIVQAVSRDIFCNAMKTLRHCFIVGHVHDELIIECDPRVNLKVVCEQMGRSLDWMPDILLQADGYETQFYKKD